MSEENTYCNLNNFPIILKTKRRMSKTINPREVVRGSWWSRYVGSRQLTRISDPRDLVPDEPRPKPLSKCSACESSCQGGCEVNLQGLQDFDHYKLVAGTYFCNYCGDFSESKGIIDSHIDLKHKEALSVKVESTSKEESDDKTIPGEAVAVSFKPDPSDIEKDVDYYWVLLDGTHRCKDCGKDCKSKAGLVKHVNSKHRSGE